MALKNYTVKATNWRTRQPVTIDVSAKSKREAGDIAQKRHGYNLSGVKVVGPF